MAAPPPPTVLTIKHSFLTTQTRLLTQPLAPSRRWRQQVRTSSSDRDDPPLPDRAVDDALVRLNHVLAQHARRALPPQAARHVAEQLDRLYWDAAEQAVGAGVEGGSAAIDAGIDFADSDAIAALPPVWDSEREADAHPLEARRYGELVGRLRELSRRRAEVEARVARLRRMRDVLAPFAVDGGVQENLVTRGGEMERELERMRMLLVRVGGRVGQLKEQEGAAGDSDSLFGDGDDMVVDDVEVEERRRVDVLLDKL